MMFKGWHYQGKLGASTGHKVGKDAHIMLQWWPIYALMNVIMLLICAHHENALLMHNARFRPKSNFYQKLWSYSSNEKNASHCQLEFSSHELYFFSKTWTVVYCEAVTMAFIEFIILEEKTVQDISTQ